MTNTPAVAAAHLNNIEKVQERLGVGRSMVFELLRTKQLKSVRVGRRRMVTEQSLRDFIAQLDQQGGVEDQQDGAENELPSADSLSCANQ